MKLSHLLARIKITLGAWEPRGALWSEKDLEEARCPFLPPLPETVCWQLAPMLTSYSDLVSGHTSSKQGTEFTQLFHRFCQVLSRLWYLEQTLLPSFSVGPETAGQIN